ncbi:hypothetical protein RhiirA4_538795 [Rhizophagus irregularis]|uniref:Myb-like domain-containing protein n=1 Tax=Rhizophagus irregularis TaxID=588596 RepID=A0A2I1G184_9GLOM|nr:hypothetical protein RhiirA4_538795 [Rhizophagus irregularis]
MPKKRKTYKSFDEIIDLTDKIKIESDRHSSPEYSLYSSQNITNQSNNQRSPSPFPPPSSFPYDDSTSGQPIVASVSRGKKRAWTKEEDQALLDSIIIELSGHWSSICSRNKLLAQRGPSMVSQRFKNSIKHKLLGGDNSNFGSETGNENGRDHTDLINLQ